MVEITSYLLLKGWEVKSPEVNNGLDILTDTASRVDTENSCKKTYSVTQEIYSCPTGHILGIESI